jgi:TonB family protein
MQVMNDPELHLLAQLEDERASALKRETFLLSVILHLVLILFIGADPPFLHRLFHPVPSIAIEPAHHDVTMLYEPPDLPKLVKPPPRVSALSDANRKAQPGSKTMQAPPEQKPPIAKEPAPSPGPPKQQRLGDESKSIARAVPPIGIPDFPEPAKEPPKQKPMFEQVPPPKESPQSPPELSLPEIARAGRGIDAIEQGLAKDHAAGRPSGGGGGGFPTFDPHDPNLNIPGPQILSDTMGVDFNPYLLRILSLVRRNWYSVIPEIARLGKQGRVILQFSIKKNGSVADLTLAGGSGTESLDGAALSSIRLSTPFPPLPPEFPGQDVRLRFIYLYNMPIE